MTKPNLGKQARYLIVIVFFATSAILLWQMLPLKLTFKVVQVIDGDTFRLEEGTAVRYIGLDTPELGKGETPDECFAQEAKQINVLVSASEFAHEQNKGLWSFCAPDPNVGCQVKGNYDKHGHRFYHLPEFRHYPQVKVNLENGDQWFCTEKEAQKAGFTRGRE